MQSRRQVIINTVKAASLRPAAPWKSQIKAYNLLANLRFHEYIYNGLSERKNILTTK